MFESFDHRDVRVTEYQAFLITACLTVFAEFLHAEIHCPYRRQHSHRNERRVVHLPVNAPMSVSSVSKVSHSVCRAEMFSGGDCQHHAFLRFGEPDLPRGKTGIFQTDAESDPHHSRSWMPSHPPRRTSPPAPQSVMSLYRPKITGADDDIDQSFFGDRVADLHGCAGDFACLRVHRHGGEGRAAQAITSCAPAEHDDTISNLRSLRCFPFGAIPTHPQKTSGLAV